VTVEVDWGEIRRQLLTHSPCAFLRIPPINAPPLRGPYALLNSSLPSVHFVLLFLPLVMCGRFSQTASPEVTAQQFALNDSPLFSPRYNIAPSQSIAAIRIDPDTTTRKLVLLRWGLIPSWAKDPKIGNQCINAKAETVAEKPAFRSAFKKRRCLIRRNWVL